MIHIFHIGTIILIARSLLTVLNPSLSIKRRKNQEEFISHLKQKGKGEDLEPRAIRMVVWYLFVIAYILLGLLTSDWIVFTAYIFISCIFMHILKAWKNKKFEEMPVFTKGVISLCFFGFILLNHYHLHIDTYQWVKSQF